MSDLYEAHYKTLVNNGVPPELAAKASSVTANETQPRTQEQQQIITEAWHHLSRHLQKLEALEDEPTLYDT